MLGENFNSMIRINVSIIDKTLISAVVNQLTVIRYQLHIDWYLQYQYWILHIILNLSIWDDSVYTAVNTHLIMIILALPTGLGFVWHESIKNILLKSWGRVTWGRGEEILFLIDNTIKYCPISTTVVNADTYTHLYHPTHVVIAMGTIIYFFFIHITISSYIWFMYQINYFDLITNLIHLQSQMAG